MAQYTGAAHWRDSARPARFFLVDARAALPLVLWLLHIRWWTFFIAIGAMFFFGLVERYGFTVPTFIRTIRTILAGPHKTASPWWRQ